jgi:hypothetical protein
MDTTEQPYLERKVDQAIFEALASRQRDPYRAKYQLICGRLKRLLGPESTIEEYGARGWEKEKLIT